MLPRINQAWYNKTYMNPNNQQDPSQNTPSDQPRADWPQPVAYDQQGRPLYAHPPTVTNPQVVHVARPINPVDVPIPEELQRRHEESRRKYPNLNLSRGEYIISAVRRHPIGILQIWAIVALLMATFGGLFYLLFLRSDASSSLFENSTADITGMGVMLLGVLFVLLAAGGLIATYVYNSNRFYLTNESVVQEIQTSLFHRHEQTVSLSNIEDASYRQNGIIQQIFNYGTIRLSTEGDETTYSFTFVTDPKRHIAVLNNAVESFKNGRPVEPNDD